MLITIYRPAHASVKIYGLENSPAAKKDRLEHMNLIEKGPKYTASAVLHPKILLVGRHF